MMWSSLRLLLIAAAAMSHLAAQVLDPAFQKVPFEQWLNESDTGTFRCSVSVSRPELTFEQRLASRLLIHVDGRQLETRRTGKLVFFAQITDTAGLRYQNHGSIDLGKTDANIKASNVEYGLRAFVLPGDYAVAVAIFDSATGEHSSSQMRFRVLPEAHDFLVNAWQSLPMVEFVGRDEVRGRIEWASSVRSPVNLGVLLNLAPARRVRDSAPLTATLQAMTQTGSPSIEEHVSVLDLARRKVVFEQTAVRDLEVEGVRASVAEAGEASIDIHVLAERHHNAQFFVSEVRKRLRDSPAPCMLIVLSAPADFESGEDLTPISTEALPRCSVFYVRYRAPVDPRRAFSPTVERRRGHNIGGHGPLNRTDRLPTEEIDQLAATLKPLGARVIDVSTPQQMTKVFIEIWKVLTIR